MVSNAARGMSDEMPRPPQPRRSDSDQQHKERRGEAMADSESYSRLLRGQAYSLVSSGAAARALLHTLQLVGRPCLPCRLKSAAAFFLLPFLRSALVSSATPRAPAA